MPRGSTVATRTQCRNGTSDCRTPGRAGRFRHSTIATCPGPCRCSPFRETALANARRDVLIAESEIRRLVGAAQWQSYGNVELLTAEQPIEDPNLVTMENAILLALQNRPELRQATQRVKAAGIRNNVTSNELLPDLKLLFGTYVSALAGDSGIEQAWQKQFSGSTPGFSGGLQFDFPWRNRAARSRHQQTGLELTRSPVRTGAADRQRDRGRSTIMVPRGIGQRAFEFVDHGAGSSSGGTRAE